ncbi:alpha-L-fucosidase [Coraliomargarita algicola]|uniref:alpha-L-fucosidase n=1 Tax=Coraliomargarita algicola TaxID=3092156 RepID=A0ABZ0RJW0_9BACT|nr:alpha-L-fucosidase [Coraliomargarita sp. J2-16]WPJ95368.1 alpha-L-fucosidase [Coraliomargarita sp. J2-16]
MKLSHPVPSTAQLAWQRTETNAFFHFSPNTFTGLEWGDGSESPAIFNPTQLDCRQWARAAKQGGLRIAILTAKHHDGFCLWPTKTTEHSVKSSPWKNGKGDVVREFVDACRCEGLMVGLYLSPWDRHEQCYGDSPRYNDFYCAQLEELLTNYGELHEVWFDGACVKGPNGEMQEYDWERYFALVKQLQPNAVTFGDGGTDVRWVGNELGIAGETSWSTIDPDFIKYPGDSGIAQAVGAVATVDKEQRLREGDAPDACALRVWRAVECDVSIRPGWFYHPEEDDQVRSPEGLIQLYFESVGRNGVLLLNLPITPEGLLHETDAKNLEAYNIEKKRIFTDDLVKSVVASETTEELSPEAPWIVNVSLLGKRAVTVLCLQEAVEHGQRIAEHHVEVNEGGEWRTLVRGTTVGYKRLYRFDPIECAELRVVVTQLFGAPQFSDIGAF